MSLPSTRFLACAAVMAAVSAGSWADQSGAATLAPGEFLNLDTGAVSSAGGDVYFDGSSLAPQGSAGLYNLGRYGSRAFKSIQARQASSVSYTAAAIPASALTAGEIFGVHTNRGNYAKAIVTATNNGLLSLQYTVFGATARAVQPAAANPLPIITQLQNNYSWIIQGAGLPNYGIAPGSIFVIKGTGLSAPVTAQLQSSAPPGLPTTLNQTSVSVTVNGTTVTPALYYTSATQIAAVLPSNTPVGAGTIMVTYAGENSSPTPIKVVANAPGLDTLYGTGNGSAVVTDNSGNVFGLTKSAMPAQTVILWGSGIGADTANDDRVYPQKTDDLSKALGVQVFIGGISATVQYAGRSQYPGLDQYNVVVPQNVTPGCFVSVVAQIGSVVSNAVTMPISANGGACSDPSTGLSGTQLQSLANKSGNVNGLVAVLSYHPGGTGSIAFSIAASASGAVFGQGYLYASQGSCAIVPPEQGPLTNYLTPLDTGTIQLSGPNGQVTVGSLPGINTSQSFNASPGTYTFAGSGGANIGHFSVNFNVPAPSLNVTNLNALGTITRSQGATVTWTGGFPNGILQVQGSAGSPAVKFFCYAAESAGQLTIPSSILLALPAGPGSLVVSDLTAPQAISATGLDIGFAAAAGPGSPKLNVTFK
ncbi:MAG TPA: hypothetical protein VKV74_07510 [Bryobacteraceae bacterium]|nr:hypothetical protein [Bryobacteraceae bacterium]